MIYRITEDMEQYMRFHIESMELYAKMGDDITINLGGSRERYASIWNTPNCHFYTNESDFPDAIKVPDITLWTTRLLLNEKALDILRAPLQEICEFLPVNCEGNTYHIANILCIAEDRHALDIEHSRYHEIDGYKMDLECIAFREERLNGVPLFKSEYDACNRIFCTEKFRDLIDTHQLKGILFRTDLAGLA